MAAIGIFYTLLAVLELRRGRSGDVWRWPMRRRSDELPPDRIAGLAGVAAIEKAIET